MKKFVCKQQCMKLDKHIMVRLKIVLLLLSIPYIVQGQKQYLGDIVNQVVSPTPALTEMQRYGSFPVSHANGAVQIEIPLYTIECDGVTVPISISYNSTGVKVDDVASIVGLGWNLNVGGVVNHVEKSSVDSQDGYVIRDKSEVRHLLDSLENFDILRMLLLEKSPSLDTESDRYYYQFGDKKGYFRYSVTDNQLITIPYTTIVIDDSFKGGYRILDDNGAEYYFTEPEYLGNAHLYHREVGKHLSMIVTPMHKDTIRFEYINSSYIQRVDTEYYQEGEIIIWEDDAEDYTQKTYQQRSVPVSENFVHKKDLIRHVVPLVSSIKWNGNEVRFNFVSDRKEANSILSYKLQEERLASMCVKNSDDMIVKTIDFINKDASNSSSRNQLQELLVYGTDTSQAMKYTFGYNPYRLPYMETAYNSPTKVLYASDFWGYYNGLREHDVDRDERQIKLMKSPNHSFAAHGILTSITYPTGGVSHFEYEGNRDSIGNSVGGLRIKSITNISDGQTVNKECYTYHNGESSINLQYSSFGYQARCLYFFRLESNSPYGLPLPLFAENERMIRISIPISWTSVHRDSPIFYPHVTKIVYDGDGHPIEKTEYTYGENGGNDDLLPSDDDQDTYSPLYFDKRYCHDVGMVSPVLISQDDYTYKNGEFVRQHGIMNSYEYVEKGKVAIGVSLKNNDILTCYSETTNGDYYPYPSREQFIESFHPYNVYAFPGYYRLKAVKETDYESGRCVTTSLSYDAEERILQPVCKTITDGSDVMTEEYIYPFHREEIDEAARAMNANNCLTMPLGTKTYHGDKEVKSTLDKYTRYKDMFLINEQWYSTGGKALERRVTVDSYDERGNIQLLTKDGSQKVFYHWDEQNRLPLVQIEVANSKVQNQVLADEIKTKIMNIGENGLRQLSIPSYRMTTYEYLPLVGIRKITAPNGHVLNYLYDTMMRLQKITDHYGRTIKTFDYNYQNK